MKSFKQYNAKMNTLYVQRKVVNATELFDWAVAQGVFKTVVPEEEMHVTCAFSKKAVDWNKVILDTKDVIVRGGMRQLSPLGDKGAIVLKIESDKLESDWQKLIDLGCSWDYDGYKPHVTITYNSTGVDISKVKPFKQKLILGPQLKSEVDLGFVDKLKEK